MSQASFLAHLSRHDQAGYYSASTSNLNQMKQERSPSIITSNSNQMKQERSWGRKPLALFRRRLNSDSRPALPPPAFALDVFDKSQPIFNVAEIKSQANNIQSDPHTTDLAPRITCFYNKPVELIRKEEYPHMNQGTYLDHSGTTIYARTLITRFSTLLLTNLYGNPHSANAPADLSGAMVDAVRLETLRFLGADPAHYDLVFTANATAAIKMVGDAFRDLAEQTRTGRFWLGLFAYPGQSNLTGRRLPLEWAGRLRSSRDPLLRDTYTLLDAAALAMTSPMGRVFADPETAPDFVCVSFYKIFGFPDLGGLVVRKESGHILALRKYFGGGTVEMVSTIGKAWHLSKGLQNAAANRGDGKGHGGGSLHEGLEDGTLPFHSILALGEAINVHAELYGSMENISAHTNMLVRRLYNGMRQLRYGDGRPLCKVYEEEEDGRGTAFGDSKRQGATVAFNVYRPDGGFEPHQLEL
ncbi:hypothetical protein N0V88_004691 [Collariella sp. IMI 366227]|nr:hypothetical protein N0V88_004691 [Collariella sp. IMI 366227]